jgi:hypothetical protein
MMLRELVKRIPGARRAYRGAYDLLLRMKSPEKVFTDIYRKNKWYGTESVSGLGSESSQTGAISAAIPLLIAELGITSIHDIPCGDFFWMSRVDLGVVEYLGSDIVAELIESNQNAYVRPHVRFSRADILKDGLCRVDMMIVRDCLVHLPNRSILQALRNICVSRSRYLLSTTFPERRHNRDIPTGRWRPINLQIAPFNLPQPLKLINERCTEASGKFPDKSLGLWRIDDISRVLL